jgi:isopenicillin N synthase-like dioxygenase
MTLGYRTHDLRALTEGRLDGDTRRVRDDFADNGFLVFDDDLIDPHLIHIALRHLDRFFRQPLEVKTRYEDDKGGHQRGYTPPQTEHALDQPKEAADLKEFWQQGRPDAVALGLLPNPTTDWPGFDDVRARVHSELHARNQMILRIIAPILGVSPEWLIWFSEGGDDITRFLRYFATRGYSFLPGTLRSAPHTDINLGTLLKAFGPGLVVRSITGQEIPLDLERQQLLYQQGDMGNVLSGGMLPATKHWVLNPEDDESVRDSIAFFNHPHPLRIIDTLPHLPRLTDAIKAWVACTERHYTYRRLIEIGILEGPSPFAHELYPAGSVLPSPWPNLF